MKHADSITYLGVCFSQGKSLKFNYSNVKANFYKTFNYIYQKCAVGNNELFLTHILKSICVPILYSVEASSDACDSETIR